MISFDLTNLHAVSNAHGLSMDEFNSTHDRISDYLDKIHARDQGFYSVIDDDSVLDNIETYVAKVEEKYKDVVVLGIGGSSLGNICLQQSLKHLFENERKNAGRKLHVLDNIDPALIREIEDVVDLSTTLFVVVTKSGGTPETLSQFFYFKERCESQGLSMENHFAFVTDPERGLLRKVANEHPEIQTFPVPQNVGGRFSVLTPVGLLPAALIGINIRTLIKGARKARDQFLNKSFDQNTPFQLATIQYLLGEKGKTMTVMMPYSQRLIKLADWYRQLLAESIGKAKNEAGETVHTGLTPINALGATDQHSQSQLYNEGPNDKLIIFINVNDLGAELTIPNPYPDDEKVAFLNGVSFNQLLKTEQKGTAQALTQYDRPNMAIEIERVDAEHLGELFMLFEGSIAFLGEFYGINAFDQPGVELSKNLTKELLMKR